MLLCIEPRAGRQRSAWPASTSIGRRTRSIEPACSPPRFRQARDGSRHARRV